MEFRQETQVRLNQELQLQILLGFDILNGKYGYDKVKTMIETKMRSSIKNKRVKLTI